MEKRSNDGRWAVSNGFSLMDFEKLFLCIWLAIAMTIALAIVIGIIIKMGWIGV